MCGYSAQYECVNIRINAVIWASDAQTSKISKFSSFQEQRPLEWHSSQLPRVHSVHVPVTVSVQQYSTKLYSTVYMSRHNMQYYREISSSLSHNTVSAWLFPRCFRMSPCTTESTRGNGPGTLKAAEAWLYILKAQCCFWKIQWIRPQESPYGYCNADIVLTLWDLFG